MDREEADEFVRVGVIVEGKVQGVCFRWETQRQAEGLGVCGWVKNLPDGRVEAVFEGSRSAVEALVAWCRRGPTLARVSEVIVSRAASLKSQSSKRDSSRSESSKGELQGFAIRY